MRSAALLVEAAADAVRLLGSLDICVANAGVNVAFVVFCRKVAVYVVSMFVPVILGCVFLCSFL